MVGLRGSIRADQEETESRVREIWRSFDSSQLCRYLSVRKRGREGETSGPNLYSTRSNLPDKLLAWLQYAAMTKARLLLKTDDDVFVNVER